MLGGSSAREAETAQFGRFRQRDAKVEVFSRALRRCSRGADAERNCEGAKREGGKS